MKKFLFILGIFLCGAAVMFLILQFSGESFSSLLEKDYTQEQTETTTPSEPTPEEVPVVLSETPREAPKVIRDYSTTDEKEVNKFPKPLQIKLEPSTGPDSLPVDNNVSNIFLTDNGNSTETVVHDVKYTLSGKVGSSIQEIEIIHGGDYTSRFLSNFESLNFTIVLSDMKVGKNTYLIRAYSRNNTVFERIFILYFYPYKKNAEDFQLRKNLSSDNSFEEGSGYTQCGPFYDKTISDDGHTVWLLMPNQYGENTQKLALGDGVNFLYSQKQNPSSENEYDHLFGEISFQDNGKIYGPLEQTLWCGQFGLHDIKKINDNEYLFTVSGGHEGEPREYYFNRSEKVFLSAYDMVRKVDGNKTYGIFSVEVSKTNIIITENRYCCDDVFSLYGFEKLYFSKTGDFIKREPLEKKTYTFGKAIKTETGYYASSKEYGYDILAEGGNYPITNPEMVNSFFEEHDECFSATNGMMCTLEYSFDVDAAGHARIKNIQIQKIIQ